MTELTFVLLMSVFKGSVLTSDLLNGPLASVAHLSDSNAAAAVRRHNLKQ